MDSIWEYKQWYRGYKKDYVYNIIIKYRATQIQNEIIKNTIFRLI